MHRNGVGGAVILCEHEVIVSYSWRDYPSEEQFAAAQEALSEVVRVLSSESLGAKRLVFGEAAWFPPRDG